MADVCTGTLSSSSQNICLSVLRLSRKYKQWLVHNEDTELPQHVKASQIRIYSFHNEIEKMYTQQTHSRFNVISNNR